MERILALAEKKADQAEVFSLSVRKTGVGFEAGTLKRIDTKEASGFALRVVKDGRVGFGVSSDRARAEDLVDRTVALAALGEEVSYVFPAGGRQPRDLALDRGEVSAVRTEDMIATGREMVESIGAADGSLKTGAGLGWAVEEVRVLNSSGFDGSYRRGSYGASASAVHVEEGNLLHVWEVSEGLSVPEDHGFLVQRVLEKARWGRKNVPFASGTCRVILHPAALADVLTAFTWYGANGRLAAKGMGPLVGREGETILDERITLRDDPLREGGVLSCPFDDEGTVSATRPLVENGVFRGFLTDLHAAAKLGVSSSGNGFREKPLEKEKSFGAGVSPDVSNLVLEPGDMTLEAMRSGADRIVEIHHLTGILLGDMTNGDFSGNLELAFLVEDGRPAGRVKNAMIGGNFYELFSRNLAGLEDRVHHTGNFGGGTGSYFLPHVCLDGVHIAAKG